VRLRAFALAIAAIVAAQGVQGADPKRPRVEAIEFQSSNYADFRQIFAREPPTGAATVTGSLTFPEEARERYPAVLIVHTIGGYQESNEGWHAAAFRRAGFATLTYDSFAARGLSTAAVIAARPGPPFASAVADAFAALRALADHPRIEPGRIGILGFSFGGEIAHLTAFEALRRALRTSASPLMSRTTPPVSTAWRRGTTLTAARRCSSCWARRTTTFRSERSRGIAAMLEAPRARRRSNGGSIPAPTTPGRCRA
jgi:dipeptidyl aminopeptidase/acylaminoacyl peptidase